MGEDEIPIEVWKYWSKGIEDWAREMCNRV